MQRPGFSSSPTGDIGPLSPRAFTRGAVGVLFLGVVALMYVCVQLGYEPAMALAGIAATVVVLIVMRKWPMVLIAGLLFVGGFKTVPAHGIAFTDPTMIALLLCAGAVALELLFLISGTSEWTVRRLMAGQGLTVFLFLLFVAILTSSFLYTRAHEYGATVLSRFLAFEVLMFFAPMLFLKRQRDAERFLLVVIFLTLLLVAKEMMDVLHPSEAVLKGNADVTRIGNGMAFSVAILILLYRQLALPRKIKYLLLGALACGLVGSAARSPLLALMITIIVSAISMRPVAGVIDRKKLLIAFILIVLAASVSLRWVQAKPGIHAKLASKEHELGIFLSGSTITGGTISERLSYYRSALDAFAQHPVLGLGLGGWTVFYSMQGDAWYPHNIFLEAAAEQGLIGLSVLLILVGRLLKSSANLINDPQYAFFFPVLVFQLVCNSFTGNIENRELWFWFGMVAVATRMSHESACARAR